MNHKKTTLTTAIAIALGCSSFTVSAALTTSATLDFDINYSYFVMDTNGNGDFNDDPWTPIGSHNGIHIGSPQLAGGSHSGAPNGTESPNIDEPWEFFGNTGMHQTTSPIYVIGDYGTHKELDMSGWNVTWNGIPSISLVQTSEAFISCSTSSCSDSSTYTLDATFHVPQNGTGFTTVNYALHLEGHVSNIPIPAAAWLFGSGLFGLAAMARRKKTS